MWGAVYDLHGFYKMPGLCIVSDLMEPEILTRCAKYAKQPPGLLQKGLTVHTDFIRPSRNAKNLDTRSGTTWPGKNGQKIVWTDMQNSS